MEIEAMRDDWRYGRRGNIIGLALIIIMFTFMFLGILSNTEFFLFMGLSVITVCVMLYLAEGEYRGVAVIISLIGVILLLIHFFG